MFGLFNPMDFLMTAGVICLHPNVVDLAAVVKDEESLKQWLCDYAAKHHISECVFVLGSGLKQVRDGLSRDDVEWRSRIEAVMKCGNAILAKIEEAGVDVTSMIEITGSQWGLTPLVPGPCFSAPNYDIISVFLR